MAVKMNVLCKENAKIFGIVIAAVLYGLCFFSSKFSYCQRHLFQFGAYEREHRSNIMHAQISSLDRFIILENESMLFECHIKMKTM